MAGNSTWHEAKADFELLAEGCPTEGDREPWERAFRRLQSYCVWYANRLASASAVDPDAVGRDAAGYLEEVIRKKKPKPLNPHAYAKQAVRWRLATELRELVGAEVPGESESTDAETAEADLAADICEIIDTWRHKSERNQELYHHLQRMVDEGIGLQGFLTELARRSGIPIDDVRRAVAPLAEEILQRLGREQPPWRRSRQDDRYSAILANAIPLADQRAHRRITLERPLSVSLVGNPRVMSAGRITNVSQGGALVRVTDQTRPWQAREPLKLLIAKDESTKSLSATSLRSGGFPCVCVGCTQTDEGLDCRIQFAGGAPPELCDALGVELP